MLVRIPRKLPFTLHRSRLGGRLALASLFILFGTKGLQEASAVGDTRTLSFQHTHRDDAITVTFKQNGRYDEEGLKKLNHFLRDWRSDDETRMDPRLFDILWEIHREVGATEPIHIISSYRSPKTNAMLRRRSRGVARFSQHILGKAIDFNIPGVPLEELRAAGLRLQRGGVGYYPGSFIHVDVGNVRHWPRISHDQLARIMHSKPGARGTILTADAAGTGSSKRGFFSKLLGVRSDEDEDGETSAPQSRSAAAASRSARQELAAVPMPRARPARKGEITLASAQSSPTPSDVISSRGYWPDDAGAPAPQPEKPAAPAVVAVAAAEAASQSPPPLANANGQRLAWITGPQPADSAAPMPRPRPSRAAGTPAAEITASTTPWPTDLTQNDRVPTDLVLAYAATTPTAANTPPETLTRPAAAPMGSLRPALAPTGADGPAATARTAPAQVASAPTPDATIAVKTPARPGQRHVDPWLRGVVITPSVHHSLSVVLLGSPDYRTLRPLMHKPRSTLALSFSDDPNPGMTSEAFSGPAISFLPTISFSLRTAALH